MLEALYEQGIAPDALVATSVGALNAAFVASRAQNVETARALASVWRALQREDVFPVSLSALVGGMCGRRDHLVPDHGLRRLIRRYLEFDDLDQAPIPLHLVAFDLNAGREVLVSRGPAVESVMAAASIPGVFPPVRIGELRLVDGGVVNNIPISHAVELGAELIYVLPTGDPSNRRLDSAPKTALDAAIHGVQLLVDSRLEADIARYSPAAELVVLPAPNPGWVQPTSFEHSDRLMLGARFAAQAALARQTVLTPLRLVGS
jgi:NTE family protein